MCVLTVSGATAVLPVTGIISYAITALLSVTFGGIVTYLVNGPQNRKAKADTLQTEISTQLESMRTLIEMKNEEVNEYKVKIRQLTERVGLLEEEFNVLIEENKQLKGIVAQNLKRLFVPDEDTQGFVELIFHPHARHPDDHSTDSDEQATTPVNKKE